MWLFKMMKKDIKRLEYNAEYCVAKLEEGFYSSNAKSLVCFQLSQVVDLLTFQTVPLNKCV